MAGSHAGASSVQDNSSPEHVTPARLTMPDWLPSKKVRRESGRAQPASAAAAADESDDSSSEQSRQRRPKQRRRLQRSRSSSPPSQQEQHPERTPSSADYDGAVGRIPADLRCPVVQREQAQLKLLFERAMELEDKWHEQRMQRREAERLQSKRQNSDNKKLARHAKKMRIDAATHPRMEHFFSRQRGGAAPAPT